MRVIEETILDFIPINVSALNYIPIGISNRHIHLTDQAVIRLFGKHYQLKKLRDLSQPGQYACKETVTVIGPKGKLTNVRVLGPTRQSSQVEITLTDGYLIGLKPPVRSSGKIDGALPIILQGPRGQLHLNEGLICAGRHIHMSPVDAMRFGVQDNEYVSVKVASDRPITFDQTLVRVSKDYRLEMHVDIDEANAANLSRDSVGLIVRRGLSE